MSILIQGTNIIFPDELAWNLSEVNLPAPDYGERHRYQIITVLRGDTLKDHHIDMGRAKNFTAGQFRVPGIGVHTVVELQDIADYLRSEKPRMPEALVLDIFKGYENHYEKKRSLTHANRN